MRTGARQALATDILTGGALKRLIRNGGRLSALRTNELLTEEQWKQIDDAVIPAAQERLVIVDDLFSRNLIHSLDGLGVLASEYSKMSDMSAAEQSMSGATRGERDLVDIQWGMVPIPVTFKEFRLEGRMLLASQRRGEALDVTNARAAGRSVAEKLEDMVFNGGDIVLAGNPIYGLTNFPDRNTHTISTAWGSVTNTDAILSDVLTMIGIANADMYFGPFWLYVAGNLGVVMAEDYDTSTTTTSRTVQERLEMVPQLSGVRVADTLADDEVVLVQMTPDVIDLAVAETIDTVEWETDGGAIQNFKVMAAMAPRLRSDYNGNCGIVHGS